ncbi:MAG: hypothetical protein NY202_01320 [Mollicutes bacterium UO1]
MNDEKKYRLLQEELDAERRRFWEGETPLFFTQLAEVDERTIFKCLVQVRAMVDRRDKFNKITTSLLEFYSECGANISTKSHVIVADLIRESQKEDYDKAAINKRLSSIINKLRAVNQWKSLDQDIDIDSGTVAKLLTEELLFSLANIKYFYEVEMKNATIEEARQKFSQANDSKELLGNYKELLKTKTEREEKRAKSEGDYLRLLGDAIAEDYQVLTKPNVKLSDIENSCQALKSLEENCKPKQIAEVCQARSLNLKNKVQELEEYIAKWRELQESFLAIMRKINENSSDEELTLLPQIIAELTAKQQHYADKNDRIIN